MTNSRQWLGTVTIILLLGCGGLDTSSEQPSVPESEGFRTTAAPYIAATTAGVTITPLATVGDLMPGSGEPFAPIPDGIGVWGDDSGVHFMVSHELRGLRRVGGDRAFEYARVSKMTIDTSSLEILSHMYVLDGSEGYKVLCSATWVDEAEGFSQGYFFTGEELRDSGRQLAIDEHGQVTEMPWIGAYAHENQIAVPGFDDATVLLNFDDTASNEERQGADNSELYMYVGASPDAVMTGQGQLYVLAPLPGKSGNVGDLAPGDSVMARWKPVPADIARQSDGRPLQAYVDSIGVFGFVRAEDGWYDKRPGRGPAAIFYATGRDERSLNSSRNGPADPWGSIYYVDFDPIDPTADVVLTLMGRSSGPEYGWASPDNGDMLPDGTVMLMEDPANSPWERPPGIFRMQFTGHKTLSAATMIARVTDPDCTDEEDCLNAVLPANPSLRWETSGIVDATEFLGPGAWLVAVQAHSKPATSLGLTSNSGQLLLLRTSGP